MSNEYITTLEFVNEFGDEFIFGEEFIHVKVLSNLFSNQFSMDLYRCVLPCVNTYLEINTV